MNDSANKHHGKPQKQKLIFVAENESFRVDYDSERRMYRVTYFEDCHFQDEFWFDEIVI